MRVKDLKIPFNDTKLILQDIEQSKKRILKVAERNPWLIDASRKIIKSKFPSNFTVYRALAITNKSELRKDKQVSTTLSLSVALNIASDFPGIVFNDEHTLSLNRYILKYKIDYSNVLIYVPGILHFLKASVGKRGNYYIEDRWGDRVRISEILRFIEEEDEQEIIADVSNISPKYISIPPSIKGGDEMAFLKKLASNKNPDIDDYNFVTPEREDEMKKFLFS